MQLMKHSFEELSRLNYAIYTAPFPTMPDKTALIVAFEGEYGYGCEGNADARFINAIRQAAGTAWEHNALILDYRAMKYEWGDMLPICKGAERCSAEVESLIRVCSGSLVYQTTLISDLNRQGISTLIESDEFFDSLEDAMAWIEQEWRDFYADKSESV